MLFLVDGYNVTKGDPATRDLSLEEQRTALVARLKARGSDLLGKGGVVVFFDGDVAQASEQPDTYPVTVEFSRGQSADDAIVRVAARRPRDQVCLVTSDRGLAERVRDHLGARLEVRDRSALFESARGRSTRRRSGGDVAGEAGTPPGANRITEELKKLWITEEGE